MKRKIIIIMILVFIGIITKYILTPMTDFNDLSGTMVVNDRSTVVHLYDYENNTSDIFEHVSVGKKTLSYDKKSIYFTDGNVLGKFNFNTNEKTYIYTSEYSYHSVSTIPTTNEYISFGEGYNICILNLNTLEIDRLVENDGGKFSWTDENHLYYSNNNEIYCYNRSDKTTERVMSGASPVIQGNKMLYINSFFDKTLNCYNFETEKKEWHTVSKVMDYALSPDGKYAVVTVPSGMYGQKVKLWNIKKGSFKTLFRNLHGSVTMADWK